MIKVLDKTKTLSQLVADNSNGLGQLKVMNDIVTEELNGIYELEFDILTTENHYEDLKTNMLVKVNVNEMDDEQIFRVYYISEPINFVSHVKCQHITYDLSKIVVKPFTATGAVSIKNGLVSYMLGSYPFDTWTDITNTTSTFTNDIPRPFRECLGGYEGSVLDVLRPEYEWDNLTVKLHARRGSDHNTRIAYGKNLTDFQQEENNESVYDAVYGYAVVDEVTYEATSIYNKTGATFPKVLNVDFSSKYETGDTPTGTELLQYATEYATNNDIEVPNVNIKISFVPLWQTEEYKNIAPLERVFLGDTVHVYFDKLGVEASSRVIKTVWSPGLKRYEEIELGSARANLNTVINDTVKEATEGIADSVSVDTGFIEKQLDDLSSLIINGLGLYKTEEQVQGGGVRIILHNKPTLAESDTQYYMSAAGIMVSTDYGVTWNAGFDTQTGELFTQALSTITLKALEIYGSFIRFGDVNSNYIDVAPYSVNDVPQGVSFDGTGTVRFQPQSAFIVDNKNDTYSYNKLVMQTLSSSSRDYDDLQLQNYTPNSHMYANNITLNANEDVGATTNRSASINIANYDTTNNTSANMITMTCATNTNRITLQNYFRGTSQKSSEIYMDSSTGTAGRINIFSYNTSGSSVNSIVMTESKMTITGAELTLTSTGGLWLNSSSSQDIHIQAADDLYLAANDKIYWRGTQVGFVTVNGVSVLGAV